MADLGGLVPRVPDTLAVISGRFVLCAIAIVVSMVLGAPAPLVAEGAVLIVIAPIFSADLGVTLRRLRPMVVLFMSIVVVHAWANPANVTPLWGPFYVEGAHYGLVTALRLLVFVLAVDILVLSVGTRRLVRWARAINADFGIILAMSLAIIPVLRRETEVTLQAQRARGLDLDAGLRVRTRAYLAAAIPVVVKALVRAHAMAGLLLVRGYARNPVDWRARGPILEAEGLSLGFLDALALDATTLTVGPGSVLAVSGPNGSGKTVLLEYVAGLLRGDPRLDEAGRLSFDGEPRQSAELPAAAMALQDPGVHLFETVLEEVAFPFENAGATPEDAEDLALALLDAWGLDGFSERAMGELSGGERQKAALAATEASNPGLVLYDEPFEQLDADSARMAAVRIRALADRGATVVVASRLASAGSVLGASRLELGASELAAWPAEDVSRRPGLGGARPRGMGGAPVLELLSTTHRFESGAGVGPVSLAVRPGEVVALVGANGAGKTTLLLAILGLIPEPAGTVRLVGDRLDTLSPAQRAARVGVVFQDPDDQIFSETVAKEVGWGLKLRGDAPVVVSAKVEAVLEELGLAKHAERNPHELTRAQRQLVALASALVGKPPLIVLDEPTTALDDAAAEVALAAVADRAAAGAAAIVATHDARVADGWATRTVRFEAGCVISDVDRAQTKEP